MIKTDKYPCCHRGDILVTTHFRDRLVVSDIPGLLEITPSTEEALLSVGFPSDSSHMLFLNPALQAGVPPGLPGSRLPFFSSLTPWMSSTPHRILVVLKSTFPCQLFFWGSGLRRLKSTLNPKYKTELTLHSTNSPRPETSFSHLLRGSQVHSVRVFTDCLLCVKHYAKH